jgi:hypothetical protein
MLYFNYIVEFFGRLDGRELYSVLPAGGKKC